MSRLASVSTIIVSVILILLSVKSNAQLCYNPETKKHEPGQPGEGQIHDTNFRHDLALRAAGLVYKMADLTTTRSANEILHNHSEFLALVPPHYQVVYKMADRGTGIKYAILVPTQAGLPHILAITGTESVIDWFSDLNLGRTQLAQISSFQYMLGYCNYTAEDGAPYSAKNWIITGHSLGGGLAQAFAYQVQRMRMKAGLLPASIELVTFNAFGASEIVENTPAQTAKIASTMTIYNYFLTDDLVSRIGTHIGPTYEINASQLKSGIGNRHALFSFNLALRGQSGFDIAVAKTPPEAKAVNFLKKAAPHLEFISESFTDTLNERLRQILVLEEATNILSRRKFSEPYDKEAARFLTSIAFGFYLNVERVKPHSDLQKDMMARLQKVQQRLSVR